MWQMELDSVKKFVNSINLIKIFPQKTLTENPVDVMNDAVICCIQSTATIIVKQKSFVLPATLSI